MRSLLAVALVLLTSVFSAERARAQPDPTFRTTCEGLRASLAALRSDRNPYVVIQVVGAVRFVGRNDAVALIGLCEPPAPRVLCVTYTTDSWKVGDAVMISGTFDARDADHIRLDPCLHAPAPP